jgi:acyl-CoA dehydrogenase
MPDFGLTPELKAVKDRAHEFAEKIMRPVARKYDETGEWAVDVYKKAWDYGYLQSLVPEDCGGPGASQLEEAIVCEELAWGCGGL